MINCKMIIILSKQNKFSNFFCTIKRTFHSTFVEKDPFFAKLSSLFWSQKMEVMGVGVMMVVVMMILVISSKEVVVMGVTEAKEVMVMG